MNLARMSIKRPTFIMALLVSLLVLGAAAYKKLSVRMYPDVEFPYVATLTTYSGAGVAEVEEQVSKKIEDAISGISGIKHITSINQDNLSIVIAEFELSKNPDIATQEVRDKVGQARFELPDEIEEPVIMKADMDSMPLITLSLKSDTLTPKQLYDFADDVVSKDFSQVSGVSQIKIVGGTKREIQVLADKNKLKEHETTLTALSSRILSNSLNIPSGKIDKGTQEYAFRTMGEFTSVKDIENVVVNFVGNDIPVTVKDVAVVIDGVVREESRARLSSKDEHGKITSDNSLNIQIFRQTKGNDVAISDAIQKRIAELNIKYERRPGHPQLTLISDNADGARKSLDDVFHTIFEGIFLAIVVVYLFLGSWRSTVITALALPNSLVGSFILMYVAGFSLNVISLMSLSLAVGLLIDDAIVVRENIFRHYEKGANPVKAAIEGTDEVTLAVVATTATVIAVFLPVSFLSGVMGKFFREFGLTVVFAMLISILDALTIAPLLSAYIIADHKEKQKQKSPLQEKAIKIFRALTVDWFNKIFDWCQNGYEKCLKFIIKVKGMKIITISTVVVIFVGSIVLAKVFLQSNFMSAPEWGEFRIKMQAQPGTSLEQMDKYTKQVEQLVINKPYTKLVSATVGSASMFSSLANQSSLYIKMYENKGGYIKRLTNKIKYLFVKDTRMTTSKVKEELREEIKKMFGNEVEISIVANGIGGGQSEFILELVGDDIDLLYDVALTLKDRYSKIPFLTDLKTNYKPGKPEVQVVMNKINMERFGVSSVVAGNEIRAMVDGLKSGKYRENGFEYDIRVQLQENQRDILKDFDSIYINNVNNKIIKLKNVASPLQASAPVQIFRKDRNRYVTVEGNLAKGGSIATVQKEAQRIFNEEKSKPANAEKWKNVEIRKSGNSDENDKMQASTGLAALFAIVFIFMILASLYESVITPITIMSALPLAIVGALLALIISGQQLDIFTIIGIIMLLGIVVKNSILMVDYTQQLIRRGLSMEDAIIKGAVTRFRPILMTSFALIAGMLPTALGLSEIGEFRKGMGIVVVGGIISSTILTLFVVPAMFEYIDIFRRFLRKLIHRPEKRMVDLTDEELSSKDLI